MGVTVTWDVSRSAVHDHLDLESAREGVALERSFPDNVSVDDGRRMELNSILTSFLGIIALGDVHYGIV